MRKKTADYMKVGYQRELTYQRSDNGFSAFGESDDASSLWLSAFVLRSFAQSAAVLDADGFYLDPAVLAGIAEFVVGLQKANGEFTPSGLVLHTDMKGGVASNGAASLAAYCTLALVEVKDLLADSSVKSKVSAAVTASTRMLKETSLKGKTAYASALITFALVKAGVATAADVDQMISNVASLWTTTARADDDVPANPWQWSYSVPSADVETVAYAVLVMTESNRLDDAYAASKWLVEKRGAAGGWQSTQDTVVGLEALSAYSAAVYAAQEDIAITVTGLGGFEEQMTLSAANFDLVQTVVVPPAAAPSALQVTAQGSGKCVVAVEVAWNEPKPTDVEPPIELETLLVPLANGGVRCEVCATVSAAQASRNRRTRNDDDGVPLELGRRASGGGGTGMATVQIQPFSGFAPASMSGVRTSNPIAKRVDNDGREGVTFYLDGITTEKTCVGLDLTRDYVVSGLKPVRVSSSDYYEPSVRNDILVSFDEQAPPGATIIPTDRKSVV